MFGILLQGGPAANQLETTHLFHLLRKPPSQVLPTVWTFIAAFNIWASNIRVGKPASSCHLVNAANPVKHMAPTCSRLFTFTRQLVPAGFHSGTQLETGSHIPRGFCESSARVLRGFCEGSARVLRGFQGCAERIGETPAWQHTEHLSLPGTLF